MAGVCLSVCPVPDPKSITEGRRKLKIGRKEAHDMGDPWSHLEVENSKVKSLGRPTPWPKTSHIFGSGRPTNYKLDVWSTSSDDPRHRHARWPPSWRLWVAVTCRGRGAYCAGPTIQLVNHIDSVLRSLNVAPRTSETTSQTEGCINWQTWSDSWRQRRLVKMRFMVRICNRCPLRHSSPMVASNSNTVCLHVGWAKLNDANHEANRVLSFVLY